MSGKPITVDKLIAWGACYEYALLRALVPADGCTVLDVLHADQIPAADRFWVVLREGLIPKATLRLFACWCARRALERERGAGREPDPRSWSAVDTSERFARGETSDEGLAAARAAAWDAATEAWGAAAAASDAAAAAAAWDAAAAASDAAAAAAAWDAAEARAAEAGAQIRELIRLLEY